LPGEALGKNFCAESRQKTESCQLSGVVGWDLVVEFPSGGGRILEQQPERYRPPAATSVQVLRAKKICPGNILSCSAPPFAYERFLTWKKNMGRDDPTTADRLIRRAARRDEGHCRPLWAPHLWTRVWSKRVLLFAVFATKRHLGRRSLFFMPCRSSQERRVGCVGFEVE